MGWPSQSSSTRSLPMHLVALFRFVLPSPPPCPRKRQLIKGKEKKKDKQINIINIGVHIKQRRIEGTAVRVSFNHLVISYQARMRLSIDCVISALECAPRKKREGDLNTYSGVYVNWDSSLRELPKDTGAIVRHASVPLTRTLLHACVAPSPCPSTQSTNLHNCTHTLFFKKTIV